MLTSLYLSTYGFGLGFFMGFFVLLVFSARISGSHFNPAVTLAFMIRKDNGGFPRMLGFAYIFVQCIGGLAGGLLGYTFLKAQPQIYVERVNLNGGFLIV